MPDKLLVDFHGLERLLDRMGGALSGGRPTAVAAVSHTVLRIQKGLAGHAVYPASVVILSTGSQRALLAK